MKMFQHCQDDKHDIYKVFGVKIKVKKNIKTDKISAKPTLYPIALTDIEKEFFLNKLTGANNYLEFGSGGSTFLSLLQSDVRTITSVESDDNWLNLLKEWKVISENLGEKIFFKYINIGKVGAWGKPIDDSGKDNYPNYSKQIFEEKNNYDVVFIDGRFRVACALQTILNCKKDIKILMHDYSIRPYYHCILDFLDIVDIVGTMCLFKVKDNIKTEDVQKMWEEYKYKYE